MKWTRLVTIAYRTWGDGLLLVRAAAFTTAPKITTSTHYVFSQLRSKLYRQHQNVRLCHASPDLPEVCDQEVISRSPAILANLYGEFPLATHQLRLCS